MKIGKVRRREETLQIHPRVAAPLVNELKKQARKRNTAESSIVEAALKTFLSQTEHEAVIDRRLNKLQREMEKLEREQQILLETLATFIKVYLAHTAEIPSNQKQTAEERGAERFEKFVHLISRTLTKRQPFTEMIQERIMTEEDFENHQVRE